MKIISQTLEIQVNMFKSWLEKETTSIVQPLNEEGRKLVDKIKERLADFQDNCQKLSDEGVRELEKGKAVRKAKVTEKLSRFFLKEADKIVFSDKLSFSELNRLNKDLQKMLSSITRERGAWFPRISPLFILARRRVDFVLSRLAGSVSELDAFLSHEYQKVKVVEELYLGIDELARLKNEIDKYGNRKATMQEKMQAIQQRIEKDRQAVESIKKSEKLGDLEDLKQKVQQLRHQVQYYLRHLEKPFMKFRNLAGGPGYSLSKEEVEKLEQYLKDPFIALATETQGFPLLKSILKKVAVAMNAGKLKLKSSRLKKAQEKIDEIVNKNALDDLRLECEHIFSLTQKLVSSEETLWAEKRLKQLEQRLGVLQRRKKAADIRLDALEREHKQLLNKVEQRKSELEETAVDILGKQVSIKLP